MAQVRIGCLRNQLGRSGDDVACSFLRTKVGGLFDEICFAFLRRAFYHSSEHVAHSKERFKAVQIIILCISLAMDRVISG